MIAPTRRPHVSTEAEVIRPERWLIARERLAVEEERRPANTALWIIMAIVVALLTVHLTARLGWPV